MFCPALDSLFFSRPDHTALSPMFSTPLPCPPAVAPEVSSTPEGLQGTVIVSRARDHLQRPAAGISSHRQRRHHSQMRRVLRRNCLLIVLSFICMVPCCMSLKVTPAGVCSSETLCPKQGGDTRNENGFERSRGDISRGTLLGVCTPYLLSIEDRSSLPIGYSTDGVRSTLGTTYAISSVWVFSWCAGHYITKSPVETR